MKRHCDGNDPYLMESDFVTPCKCGLIFDDVNQLTFYPHDPIPDRRERSKRIAQAIANFDIDWENTHNAI